MARLTLAVVLWTVAVALVGATPPARSPPTPAAAEGLPADILCGVYGGDYCKGAQKVGPAPAAPKPRPAARPRTRRQSDPAQDLAVDPDQICTVFGGPSCPAKENQVYESCECPNGAGTGCECVPYYQCDGTTGEFNKDGVGLIDIRQKQNASCQHYMQQCCRIREGAAPTGPGDNGGSPSYPGDNGGNNGGSPSYPGDNGGNNGGSPSYPGDNGGNNGGSPSYPGDNGGSPPTNIDPVDIPAPIYDPKQPCGVRNRGGVGSRISGAMHDETQFGEIPWMVAIFKKKQGDKEYLCGGGLIAPNVVLTAAHCINDKTPYSLTVRAGEWDSRTEDEAFKHQDRDVDQIITHPDYKEQSLHNDVGLLVLKDAVKIGYHIGTICLPEQGQTFDHKSCLVSGWGKDVFGKDGVYQNILRRIDDLPVVPHSQCQDKLRRTRLGAYFRLNKSFMCAGGIRGKDACTGDGGSPLVCPMSEGDDARYLFSGIVSWGVGCGDEDVPGVYANVALFRTWVEETLANLNIQICTP